MKKIYDITEKKKKQMDFQTQIFLKTVFFRHT